MTPKEEVAGKSRVVVIEDHPVLCDGLRQLIDKQPDLVCVGVADNTSDARRLVEQSLVPSKSPLLKAELFR